MQREITWSEGLKKPSKSWEIKIQSYHPPKWSPAIQQPSAAKIPLHITSIDHSLT